MKSFLQTKLSRTLCAAFFIIGLFASVNSKAVCTASFYSVPDSVGNGVNFVNTSTGTSAFTNYYWTFGDNSTGSNTNEYHTYNASGWYLVCLTIIDSLNGCYSSTCDSVFAGNAAVFCQAMFTSQANGLTASFVSQSAGNNLNYHWDFGDGSTAANQNATHSYALGGQYLVCLTIWNSTCSDTVCNYVTVSAGGNCAASFYAADSAGVTYFINTSTGTNFLTTSYYWDFGDGSYSTDMDPTHTYNGTGGYLACLTISDSTTGCSSTFCDSVGGNGGGGGCQALFTWVADSVGNGFSFYNSSTGTNATTDYIWTASDGTTGTGNFFYHVFNVQGWYAVCLYITVYDSLHQNILCTSQMCDSIYAGNGGGSQCQAFWNNQTNLLTSYFADLSSGTDTVVSWNWDFGDSTFSSQQNPVHTYATSGYYYVCLTIETASNGTITCTSTYCSSIYVGNNTTGCQANFSMYPDSSGMGFQFQNISTGTSSATTYSWDFGDGGSSTMENPFHTYSTTGYYTVCLTIADSNCTSTICDSLSVGSSFFCNAYFLWNGDSTNGVQFYENNNGLTGIVYEWNFGDGDSSSLADPYHQYAAAGSYLACLTVFQLDTNGVILCTSNYCDSVYVGANAMCAPQITAVPDSNGWGNGNVNFSVYSPCGTITSVTWDFGDGTTGTGTGASHQYSGTGWYIVCVDIVVNGITYTQCDSVFALRLMSVADVANTISSIDVYPNPASSAMNISYSLNDAHSVTIKLYDVTGREVKQMADQKQTSGLHKLVIDVKDISAGIYLLKISADETNVAKRIVVNR